nr:metal-dependent hydrolase [uncultured Flavobacterium sp.]
MDSISQVVLGAAVSNAVLGKKIGNRSIVYGALIGTIPDLDVWIAKFFYDPITQVQIHRGFSHSILFYLILSFLLAFLIFKIEKHKEVTFKQSYLAVFLILFTHSILDVFTTWGTQLFWPFFDKMAFKSIFVIDPLYTIPFFICLLISMRFPKQNKKRFFWNNLGIGISSMYLIVTLLLKFNVYLKVSNTLENNNVIYSSLVVKPSAMNTILWNIIVETEDAFLISDYSFFDSKPITFEKHLKNHKLIESLNNEPIIIQLKEISENQFIITSNENKLQFNDLRFGLLSNTSYEKKYAFSYELINENGKWKAVEVPKEKRDGVKLLKDLWFRLQGN